MGLAQGAWGTEWQQPWGDVGDMGTAVPQENERQGVFGMMGAGFGGAAGARSSQSVKVERESDGVLPGVKRSASGSVMGGFGAAVKAAGTFLGLGRRVLGAAASEMNQGFVSRQVEDKEGQRGDVSATVPFGTPLSAFREGQWVKESGFRGQENQQPAADSRRAELPQKLPQWKLDQTREARAIQPVKTVMWIEYRRVVETIMGGIKYKKMVLKAGESVWNNQVGDAAGFEVPWQTAISGQVTTPLLCSP